MKQIIELHNQAMDQAEMALMAKLKGDFSQFDMLTREAFENERRAAELACQDINNEPTRSVLLRSAASLALDCVEYREAERLIAVALAGSPPNEIAEELRDLLEQVYFQRHLELRGVSLSPNEFQMSIAGDEVGYGMANSGEFLKRVSNTETLIYRTAERKRGRPFREKGRVQKELKQEFELFVSVPRAASFAITLKLGGTIDQLGLFSDEVIDELFSCIELFNAKKEEELKKRIDNDAYYVNFKGIAKQIAPDGKRVKMVGFTAVREGTHKKVALTIPSKMIESAIKAEIAQEERVRIQGQLKLADATSRREGVIGLVDEQGKQHEIIVPEGMMSDIVKPLWEDIVIVSGLKIGKKIRLEDILKADEE